MPPGPPVLPTLVAEVYGPPGAAYAGLIGEAERSRKFFLKTAGVVDVDTTVETAEPRFRFLVDRDKAALSGLRARPRSPGALALAQAGETVGRVHLDRERRPWTSCCAGRAARALLDPGSGPARFQKPRRRAGALAGVGPLRPGHGAQGHYRKNLQRVVFVTGDTAGLSPVECHPRLEGRRCRTSPCRRLPGQLRRGRGVEDHARRLPRPGHRLRRGPDRHLHPAGPADLVLHHAAGDHGGHPADHDRRHAGFCPAEPVFRRRRSRATPTPSISPPRP